MEKPTVVRRLAKALGREATKTTHRGRTYYTFADLVPDEYQLVASTLDVQSESLTDYRSRSYTRWVVDNGTFGGVVVYTDADNLRVC